MKQYNLVLKNGHVIDPRNNINEIKDVAIVDNKIAKVCTGIDESLAEKIIDATGLMVTPGLIDAHVHCYFSSGTPKAWAGDLSLQPDYFNFQSGVTTMIDTGSSGSYNFEHFRTTVIERFKTRIFALLNIADYGMTSLTVEQFPQQNDYEEFVRVANENSDVIKGIKVAHYWGADWHDIEYAKKVQADFKKPIMVDFGVFKKERPFDQLLMDKLDSGDIITHCFKGAAPIVDENGKLYDYLHKAREKGIVFDLGHGAGSFILRNAVPALEQGFYPDMISSDLHGLNINGAVVSMSNLLSKIIACCDISMFDLFKRVTSQPAELLELGNIGSLSNGVEADVALWSVDEGNYGFSDVAGGVIKGTKKLVCEMTVRNGEIVWDLNGLNGTAYTEMEKDYGYDKNMETVVTPTY